MVLNFRASPDQMTVKAHGRAKPRWDIATNDDLARVVLLGLSAPVSVITLSDEEFSVFVGEKWSQDGRSDRLSILTKCYVFRT